MSVLICQNWLTGILKISILYPTKWSLEKVINTNLKNKVMSDVNP